jgi:hypothetical protein
MRWSVLSRVRLTAASIRYTVDGFMPARKARARSG